jgi:hypothetical protein
MKDDLPYFSHDNDARNHAKMKALRARFGWTGYGQFWALNEMIAGASQARLDLSRKVVKAAVACELGMTPSALDDLLLFLSNKDECGLINLENGIVTTDRTKEDYSKTEAGRQAAKERYARKNKTSPEKSQTSPEKGQTSPELRPKTDREQNRIEENRIENSTKITRPTKNQESEDQGEAPASRPMDKTLSVKVRSEDQDLYKAIWDSFLAKTPAFTNYPKESKATHKIIEYCRQHDKDNPVYFAKLMLEKYYNLTESGAKFWREQPFVPSRLASPGIFDMVAKEVRGIQAVDTADVPDIPF